MIMGEKLYNLREAANLIHYSERQTRQFCIDGKIKASKVANGRKWLITESALNEFAKSDRGQEHLLKLLTGKVEFIIRNDTIVLKPRGLKLSEEEGEIFIVPTSKTEIQLTEQEIKSWQEKAKSGDKLVICERRFSSISPFSGIKRELQKL